MILPKFTIEFEPEHMHTGSESEQRLWGSMMLTLEVGDKPRKAVAFNNPEPAARDFREAFKVLTDWALDWAEKHK